MWSGERVRLRAAAILVVMSAGCDPMGQRARAECQAREQEGAVLRARLAELERLYAAEQEARARAEARAESAEERAASAEASAEAPPAPPVFTCAGDRCTLSRADFDVLLADPVRISRGARVVPNMREGQPHGFKMFGIRPGTLGAQIGMRNGDVVTEISGHSLLDINSAMAAFAALKERRAWTIKGERAGAPFAIEVSIRE